MRWNQRTLGTARGVVLALVAVLIAVAYLVTRGL
jgi:hypothetical protein